MDETGVCWACPIGTSFLRTATETSKTCYRSYSRGKGHDSETGSLDGLCSTMRLAVPWWRLFGRFIVVGLKQMSPASTLIYPCISHLVCRSCFALFVSFFFDFCTFTVKMLFIPLAVSLFSLSHFTGMCGPLHGHKVPLQLTNSTRPQYK